MVAPVLNYLFNIVMFVLWPACFIMLNCLNYAQNYASMMDNHVLSVGKVHDYVASTVLSIQFT